MQLRELLAFTDYLVSVSASTAAGEGPRSKEVAGKTGEGSKSGYDGQTFISNARELQEQF